MDELWKYNDYNNSDVDGKSDLVVIHVNKSIGLFSQLVALCDVAIPGVTCLIMSMSIFQID